MTTHTTLFHVRILPSDAAAPAGKLADAELEFCGGALNGLRLIGFGIWTRRHAPNGAPVNVTFPARQYSVNGERRSFALLRPMPEPGTDFEPDAMRDAIIAAYNAHVIGTRPAPVAQAPTPEPIVATPPPAQAPTDPGPATLTRELFDAFLEAPDAAAVTMAAPTPEAPLTSPERAAIARTYGIDMSEGPEAPALPPPPAPPVRFVKLSPTGGRMMPAPRFEKGTAADALMGLL